jgi:UDP-GlcNAc:undecaprenyl-phosphate GlcNAc-1-phosphate transferase
MCNLFYFSLLLFILLSFLLEIIFVPLNIKYSKILHILDHPNERNIHESAMPLAGGISLFFASMISMLIYIYFFNSVFFSISESYKIFIGGFGITILGLFDDIFYFSAKIKLFFQVLIILFMYYLGFQINVLTNPFGVDLILGYLSLPITIFWFLLVINAINLIDGMDGLAAGISMITFLVLMFVGIKFKSYEISIISAILLGSTVGFLKYNFFPAKIFLGDSGSLFLGYIIAIISISGTGQSKGITAITLLVPLSVLFLPLTDTVMAIFRRVKNRKNIFKADKEHIHHKLLDMGLSQKTIALISYFITFLFGLIAIGFSYANKSVLLVTVILLTITISSIIFILFKKEFFK